MGKGEEVTPLTQVFIAALNRENWLQTISEAGSPRLGVLSTSLASSFSCTKCEWSIQRLFSGGVD